MHKLAIVFIDRMLLTIKRVPEKSEKPRLAFPARMPTCGTRADERRANQELVVD